MTTYDYYDGRKHPHFSWVSTESVLESKSLEEALEEIRYQPVFDDTGNICDIKFIIADVYHGSRISVAAMFPDKAEIVINPAMVDEKQFLGQKKKMMDQLSVLVRHELLHFLLVHSKRMIIHLSKKDPD